jgi:Undecaprenyl-phosphate galactose phosphotransferase WbaP
VAINILLQDDQDGPWVARPTAVSERLVAAIMIVADGVLMLLIGGLALLTDDSTDVTQLVTLTQLMFFVGWKLVFGLYPGHGLARAQRMRQVIVAVLAGLVCGVGLVELMGRLLASTPHVLPVWPIVLGAVVAALSDPLVRRVLMRLGRWQQPVFIFGGGEAAIAVVRQLAFYPYLGLRAVCIVDETSVYIADEHQGIPVIRFRELGNHAALLAITNTAVVIEQSVERSFILRLYTTGIFRRILLIPNCHDLLSLNSHIRRVGSMMAIEAGSERPSALANWSKRAFDLFASGVALLVLGPAMWLIGMLIRYDSTGPALFSQPRWAGGDREFTALKFRTMHVDGERRLRRYFLNHPKAERQYARYRKLDNDPRVTTLGRFLRATSLDELPQLLNVWRGEMSIVGPRPYTMDELGKLGPATEILGLVRPGITGFWQVSGRNQRTFRERIEMDCYYVRNFSPWLDLWILYRTVIAVLFREGK